MRRVGETALRSVGYTVFPASGGAEALRIVEEHGNGIALLVTDVVMPGTASSTGEANFLPKPFTPVSLANKVREVLDME